MNKIILFCAFIGLANFAFASTLKVAIENKEDFPHVIGDGFALSEKPGVAIEIMQNLADELGMELEIVRQPWKRCIHCLLHNGDVDILVPASFKESRLEYGLYPFKDGKVDASKRYTETTYSFYRLKDSRVNWDGEEISGLQGSIGAPLGYSIVDDLSKMGFDVQESTVESSFKKLVLGRVELVAALELAGDKILADNDVLASKVEKIKVPLKTKNYYVMLSKQFVQNNQELAVKIWDIVEKLRSTKYDDIFLTYSLN